MTWHGFALNVTTDLSYFDLMVPCGIEAVTMTSVARELGPNAPGIDRVSEVVAEAFGAVFGLAHRHVDRPLLTDLPAAANAP